MMKFKSVINLNLWLFYVIVLFRFVWYGFYAVPRLSVDLSCFARGYYAAICV